MRRMRILFGAMLAAATCGCDGLHLHLHWHKGETSKRQNAETAKAETSSIDIGNDAGGGERHIELDEQTGEEILDELIGGTP